MFLQHSRKAVTCLLYYLLKREIAGHRQVFALNEAKQFSADCSQSEDIASVSYVNKQGRLQLGW